MEKPENEIPENQNNPNTNEDELESRHPIFWTSVVASLGAAYFMGVHTGNNQDLGYIHPLLSCINPIIGAHEGYKYNKYWENKGKIPSKFRSGLERLSVAIITQGVFFGAGYSVAKLVERLGL